MFINHIVELMIFTRIILLTCDKGIITGGAECCFVHGI